MHTHLPGNVRQYLVAVFEFYAKHRIWERLGNRSFYEDRVVFRLGYWTPPWLRRAKALRYF